jgi:GlpG protein
MRVIETDLDEDLSSLSRLLWERRVRHRIYEERGRQIVELADASQAAVVREAYDALSSGRLIVEMEPRPKRRPGLLVHMRRYPGLALLITLAVVLFPFTMPLAEGRVTYVAGWLTIVDLRQLGSAPAALPELVREAAVWRWFAPMLIHFNAVHLLFNCAVVIEMGRRIESRLGAYWFWAFVLVVALVANLGQYAMNANPLFGGLSGVAFGLLGFVLAAGRLAPAEREWQVPPAVAGGLLFFLVLFSTGVTEYFGLHVANAAHWFGLGSGAALGIVTGRLVGSAR